MAGEAGQAGGIRTIGTRSWQATKGRPYCRRPREGTSPRADLWLIIVTADLGNGLEQTDEPGGKRHQVTVNTLMQAAWGVILQKYNGTNDAVFGSVVAGRPAEIPGIESMIGLFINTVPVRVN